MPNDRKRLATLQRLARVRSVERFRARAELAEAHAENRRLSDLARRTRAMEGSFAESEGVVTANALATSFAFRGEVRQLALSAKELGEAAMRRSEEAQSRASVADHRLDHIDAALLAERTQIEARSELSRSSDAPRLARRLQGQEPASIRGDHA